MEVVKAITAQFTSPVDSCCGESESNLRLMSKHMIQVSISSCCLALPSLHYMGIKMACLQAESCMKAEHSIVNALYLNLLQMD